MSHLLALALATTLLFYSTINHAAIGQVTDQTGPMEIVRKNQTLESQIKFPVEMLDTVTTAKSRAEITFEDHTKVKITEQSKLIIDDFVYDNKKGAGKLAVKVVLGTAKYTSGQIAKNNPQAVSVKTPTATIAVRGTDFSMTVDELGRSMIILLPSCDQKTCVTGAIEVTTLAGSVYLDVAYQMTYVQTSDRPPTKPVMVSLDPTNISNLLIVSPPKELNEEIYVAARQEIDINYLDQDLLKFDDLDDNQLDEVKEIDINFLDVKLLANLLDIITEDLGTDYLESKITLLPAYSPNSGLAYYFNDDQSKITIYRLGAHNAYVTSLVEENKVVNLLQDGVPVKQNINQGGSTTINIIQR